MPHSVAGTNESRLADYVNSSAFSPAGAIGTEGSSGFGNLGKLNGVQIRWGGFSYPLRKCENRSAMPVTQKFTIETVRIDDEHEVDAFDRQVIQAGMERVRADREKLRTKGLLGDNGEITLTELPDDLQPGSERDFGG